MCRADKQTVFLFTSCNVGRKHRLENLWLNGLIINVILIQNPEFIFVAPDIRIQHWKLPPNYQHNETL